MPSLYDVIAKWEAVARDDPELSRLIDRAAEVMETRDHPFTLTGDWLAAEAAVMEEIAKWERDNVKILREDTRLVVAAIRINGVVYTGKRHHEILGYLRECGFSREALQHDIEWDQGFLAQDGTFIYRRAAKHVAIDAGQVPNDDGRPLTSEDLW